MSLRESVRTIVDGRGAHFDPAVVDAFLRSIDQVLRVYVDFADQPGVAAAEAVDYAAHA